MSNSLSSHKCSSIGLQSPALLGFQARCATHSMFLDCVIPASPDHHQSSSLQWRHNERDCSSNHRRLGCLLNRLLKCRSRKTSTLRVTGLCEGVNLWPVKFPSQRVSNAENVYIWWRHHDIGHVGSAGFVIKGLICVKEWRPHLWNITVQSA